MRVTGGAQEARTISMFAELETLKTNKNLETSDLRIIPGVLESDQNCRRLTTRGEGGGYPSVRYCV